MITLTVSSDCLLEEISPDLEKALKECLTIDNPKYKAALKYGRWIGKKLQPKLIYYESSADGIHFPRGFANQAVLLCREYMGESPEIVDQRRLLPKINLSFEGALRPYQQDAVRAVAGHSFGVLEAGTGSGKTVMALSLIAERQQPTLVIVHTKELLYQWRDRIEEFLAVRAGLIGDGKFDIQPVTVAIVNSARKKCDHLVPFFGHLIVDECHRVPASLFTGVVSRFDSQFLLGLSATAFRSDDGTTRLIYYFMGDRLHRVSQEALHGSGAIVKPECIQQKTSFSYGYRGEYQPLITALTVHEGRNMQIINDVVQVCREKESGTILLVSDRTGHCQLFVDQLVQRGIKAVLLTGKVAAEQRNAIVKAVQNDEVQVLVATLQLIGEGFDCSGLSTLFLTTPITFEGRLLQVIGRIMRPAAGKRARIFDYADDDVAVLRRSARNRQNIIAGL